MITGSSSPAATPRAALRAGKSFKPFTAISNCLLPIFRRRQSWAAWQAHRSKLQAVFLSIAFSDGDNHLCVEESVGHLAPEGLPPRILVQLLSTDYKFAVSFVIL